MAGGEAESSHIRCFEEWMNSQVEDLSELLNAVDLNSNNANQNDQKLSQLAQKGISHFKNYIEKRSQLATRDVSVYFAPIWCSPWEISLLWIAGCRPSIFVRLGFALSGSEIESKLADFLHGNLPDGKVSGLSPEQLVQLNNLQMKTIEEEEKLTRRLASLQEEIADKPIAIIAKRLKEAGEVDDEVGKALEEHDKDMLQILQEADKLRLSTLRDLVQILTPLQTVDFLAASKKLHLCVHKWGKARGQICSQHYRE